jgi:hypothetical protein
MHNQTMKQQQLAILKQLVSLMSIDNDLPRDLQLVFQDIEEYITRNTKN